MVIPLNIFLNRLQSKINDSIVIFKRIQGIKNNPELRTGKSEYTIKTHHLLMKEHPFPFLEHGGSGRKKMSSIHHTLEEYAYDSPFVPAGTKAGKKGT